MAGAVRQGIRFEFLQTANEAVPIALESDTSAGALPAKGARLGRIVDNDWVIFSAPCTTETA